MCIVRQHLCVSAVLNSLTRRGYIHSQDSGTRGHTNTDRGNEAVLFIFVLVFLLEN